MDTPELACARALMEPPTNEVRRQTLLAVDQALQQLVTDLSPDALADGVRRNPGDTMKGETADVVKQFKEDDAPERGSSLEDCLDVLFHEVRGAMPRSLNTSAACYQAYVPGGGVYPAALADYIANTNNRYTGVRFAAPALVQLESNTLRWMCNMVGYPNPSSLGTLTSGGSVANVTALVCARSQKLGESFMKGVVYTSSQAHHCVVKAAITAGIPRANIRMISVDSDFKIDTQALRSAISKDGEAGLQPFCIVANAGTTNTGAVDDLTTICTMAREHNIWVHVDACYGGFFALTSRGQAALRGLDQADSIALDPHKSLFLPYGTGCLLVRDYNDLRKTFSYDSDYIQEDETELVDFSESTIELSRDFRGLRVWLPIKMFGLESFRIYLDEKLDLAQYACTQLQEIQGIVITTPPQLSIFAFRLVLPNDKSVEELNTTNRALLKLVNEQQRVHLSPTTLNGEFVLRVAIVCFRTHKDAVDATINSVRRAVDALRKMTR